MESQAHEVAEVLAYGRDEQGNMTRLVRYADGSEGTQTAKVVTVETSITRADGTVEAGGAITDIRVGSPSQ